MNSFISEKILAPLMKCESEQASNDEEKSTVVIVKKYMYK